jgi:hypothetical protein
MLLLLAFVLLLFLPGPWNVIGFVVALALFIGEIAYWNSTVKGRRARVGAEDADRQDRHRDLGVPAGRADQAAGNDLGGPLRDRRRARPDRARDRALGPGARRRT